MGCCASTATPPPKEYVGFWQTPVSAPHTTSVSINADGTVRYRQIKGNAEKTFEGGMVWTEDFAVGKICCISLRLDVEEKPHDDPEDENTRLIKINGDVLKSPKPKK